MNRRKFAVRTLFALFSLAVLPLTLTGCVSARTLLNVAITAVLNLLKIAGNSPLVAGLSAALTALQQAVASWTGGSITQDVIDAANTVAAVLDAIPATAPFSALIDVAVAGFDAVIALFPSAPTSAAALRIKAMRSLHRGSAIYNEVRAKITKPGAFHTGQGEFTDEWNTTAVATGYPQAKI